MKRPSARSIAVALALTATAAIGTTVAAQGMRGDKTMTRAEVETHSAAMFARMDFNKDGKLDPADREARRNAMFDRLDTDKNGQLSRAEFSARPERPGRMGQGGMGQGQMNHGQMNQGGPRGEGGMHKGHGMRHGMKGHRGMMMARMADANKDGAISQAEFTAAALAHFDKVDADKDGKVTREERQAAHKAMREAWKAGNRPPASQ